MDNSKKIYVYRDEIKALTDGDFDFDCDSPIRKLERDNIVIGLDCKDNLHIIKNRYGGIKSIDKKDASKLISKIVANTILEQKESLKFFTGSLEQEIFEACEKIFQKWGYINKKYSVDLECEWFDGEFDE